MGKNTKSQEKLTSLAPSHALKLPIWRLTVRHVTENSDVASPSRARCLKIFFHYVSIADTKFTINKFTQDRSHSNPVFPRPPKTLPKNYRPKNKTLLSIFLNYSNRPLSETLLEHFYGDLLLIAGSCFNQWHFRCVKEKAVFLRTFLNVVGAPRRVCGDGDFRRNDEIRRWRGW